MMVGVYLLPKPSLFSIFLSAVHNGCKISGFV